MSSAPAVTDSSFDKDVLQSDLPVLVDFWAPWCGPCRMVAPVVEEISKDFEGKIKVFKLNTDENPNVASQYGIRSIPTLMIFKGCLLYTSPSPRDGRISRMPSSA